jgi:hypothetical protein
VILPHADVARVDREKIVDYLLASDHPEGSGKAVFFSRFGFTIRDWQILADALKDHARRYAVNETEETVFGTKYRIDGPISCPDGRSPVIRSVWILDAGTHFPRRITAHPL